VTKNQGATEGAGRVRGFPAFPADRRRGARGRSWWARAWIDALEETSLAAEPLRRGRRTATAGLVGPITISPGRIAAPVHGGADSDRDAPYATVVHLDRLSDAQWDRLCAQIASRAGHLAALLDHDMPYDLADAAADADAPLLPGIGDLEPECDCDGWEHPCEHAAALCYQAAWLLDDDPFILMLLRGRAEPELLTQLQTRNATLNLPTPTDPTPTDPAREVYGAPVPGLPAPPPPDDLPTTLAAPAFVPSPADGITPDALVLLAADAAARARTLLTTGPPPAAPADVWTDTVRLAAEHPHDLRLRANLEQGLNRGPEPRHGRDVNRGGGTAGPERLARAVAAWHAAGADGLATLEDPWTPRRATPGWRTGCARAADALTRARADGTWAPGGAPETHHNRWTPPPPRPGTAVELRFGRDLRWHPYRTHDGAWWPAGPPQPDAADALATLTADPPGADLSRTGRAGSRRRAGGS
jgi:uncharacterized Zn finger protein